MPESPWHQANVAFADWDSAETTALTHLAPLLRTAEDEGALAAWFHIRKNPCWRVRYQPANDQDPIPPGLDALTVQRHITGWTEIVYEPETHAFGGPEAMDAAHRLFHSDSRSLTIHLPADASHRLEISLLLCSLLMRSAGLDWYEQGDVWARVSNHRALPTATDAADNDRHRAAVHRLISVNTEEMLRSGGSLAHLTEWARAYTDAGTELAHLAATGRLRRGLRDVIAHHVLFAWNRVGLPYDAQATLAAAAKTVIFGPDPTTDRNPQDRADTV
ncbi:thiopeptide-type bacteriocin biosynthesis protein [Streptomyces sp. V4I23]|uniref:thiopeptide-type bacteriocin biosynthesis protein n=1 Tax=Streptomyces sp. V4I23 TaxID=3042282 RepID=UPI002782C061|nr:thiopeptide-type bacteriocin biosynthesis protein [Streptomyces sp. V4I23]MDQ1006666.1 thiopeptide-type bacteriocin biosynthesis protein [Streptomyces sp. V4I23]